GAARPPGYGDDRHQALQWRSHRWPLRRDPAIAVSGSWHWTERGTGMVHALPWPAADAVLGVAGRSITAAWTLYGARAAARSGTIRPARGQRGTATTPLSVRRP